MTPRSFSWDSADEVRREIVGEARGGRGRRGKADKGMQMDVQDVTLWEVSKGCRKRLVGSRGAAVSGQKRVHAGSSGIFSGRHASTSPHRVRALEAKVAFHSSLCHPFSLFSSAAHHGYHSGRATAPAPVAISSWTVLSPFSTRAEIFSCPTNAFLAPSYQLSHPPHKRSNSSRINGTTAVAHRSRHRLSVKRCIT